ncbi:E3 ubiquitin-protein ligase SIAH2-like [Centruroides sculpturatus]|uniref:E3 ubiquitin-protein ligase SIAH2-like n=1 Tax=Centruroides sculpturatus TaxID=218467 RepID=UPI000C6E937E|nr:E3 ubiquitin-protein ligase SIAH2-like [Centruroides sculpturatus]
MEKMVEAIALPSQFKDNGCQVVQKLQKRRIHEQHCLYQKCECPSLVPTCSWEGAFQTLVEHLRYRHRLMVLVKAVPIKLSLVGLDSTHPLLWATRMNCHGHEFVIQVKKSETEGNCGRISLVIRFVGSKRGVSRFQSFLLVGGKGKALAWNSAPKSVMEETRKIRGGRMSNGVHKIRESTYNKPNLKCCSLRGTHWFLSCQSGPLSRDQGQ